MKLISAFIFYFFQTISCAQSVDVTSLNQVKSAAEKIASVMMNYHNKGAVRSVIDNGPKGFQWYEGGLFYGAMMEYIKTSQDEQYGNSVVNALTKESWGKVGDFLGNRKALSANGGKWNDDILWWSMGVVTGAEIFGKDSIMPGGVSYFLLADNTYQDVMAEYDDTCGGGVYWIRSSTRVGKTSGGESFAFKSTISNLEMINHAARLGKLSGDRKYFDQADQFYQFLLKSGLITSSFEVIDGIGKEDNVCKISLSQFSYESGMASGSLAYLYYSTKNEAYLDTAHKIFQTGLKTFTQRSIVYDACEENQTCAQNTVKPKGTLVRGWGHLHEFSNSPSIQSQIRVTLQATVVQMLKTCDANWNCGDDWLRGSPPSSYNIHFQINALELITSYLKTFYQGPVGKGLSAPKVAGESTDGPPPFNPNSSISFSISSNILITLLVVHLLFVLYN